MFCLSIFYILKNNFRNNLNVTNCIRRKYQKRTIILTWPGAPWYRKQYNCSVTWRIHIQKPSVTQFRKKYCSKKRCHSIQIVFATDTKWKLNIKNSGNGFDIRLEFLNFRIFCFHTELNSKDVFKNEKVKLNLTMELWIFFKMSLQCINHTYVN